MKILCLGDIVGRPGRDVLTGQLAQLRKDLEADLVIANGENAAGGSGIIPKTVLEILAAGVDVITTGDHVWDKPEIFPVLDANARIVRPHNFPPGAPGRGWTVVSAPNGTKVGVVNVMGRTFMKYPVNCPFRGLEEILAAMPQDVRVIVVDMHAETTSEKVAFGHFADGRVSAIFGTHTHIMTADETVLPGGTAYITDVGMTGPYDSIIGQKKEIIITRFLTGLPQRFEVATCDPRISGVLVTIDETTGKAQSIQRVQRKG